MVLRLIKNVYTFRTILCALSVEPGGAGPLLYAVEVLEHDGLFRFRHSNIN